MEKILLIFNYICFKAISIAKGSYKKDIETIKIPL